MTDSAAAGQARRLIERAVEALPEGRLAEQLAGGETLRVKLGIDPTAPDIHLGHVVVLDELRAFQDAGHLVVLIIGDYTARVGDPSGRVAERPVLTEEQIAANAQTFQEQAFKVLDPERTEVRRNSEWLAMGSDELFGLVRRFTVARLLEREEFSRRMQAGEPISILELLYPVLQGYDSVAVEADVEVGGTDQKFNLLFGRDVQEAFGQPAQSILTMPILPGTDGVRRMSKSFGNYVGVTDAPEEMFGKLMSVPDTAMGEYYRLLLGAELDPERGIRARPSASSPGGSWSAFTAPTRRLPRRSASTSCTCEERFPTRSRRRWWRRAARTGRCTCRRCWPSSSASVAARRAA